MKNHPSSTEVFIVFQWSDNQPAFQGVFDDADKAVGACRTSMYCVCPAYMNETLPHDPSGWPGAWYPKREPRPASINNVVRELLSKDSPGNYQTCQDAEAEITRQLSPADAQAYWDSESSMIEDWWFAGMVSS